MKDVRRTTQRLASDGDAGDHGLGLGLSIVRAIAVLHGATLTARAQTHGGRAVEVGFPTAASLAPRVEARAP